MSLNTSTPILADKPTLTDGPHPPSMKLRIDTLNTTTPNLADEPTWTTQWTSPQKISMDFLKTITPKII